MLLTLEAVTAAAAITGGLLLCLSPDGHLLRADPQALHGTPFASWLAPGVLLLLLVGGGFTVAAVELAGRARHAGAVSFAAGAGLVGFEDAEIAWLGFQPLEAVFIALGLAMMGLAVRACTE